MFGTQVKFMMGNEIAAQAAKVAGAKIMFGYPITPSTEILEVWAKFAAENPKLQVLQTEDETSAGFGVLGAVLAGVKAFTATAGPGHILMQDPISMAESMRLPFVGIIMQRGGPSTGTVIYSQQEVNLACFGANGEGLRIVYCPSNLQELYDLIILAFNSAWKYRFPTLILADGYLAKAKGKIRLKKPRGLEPTKLVLGDEKKIVNLPNTYDMEEDLYQVLQKDIREYEKIAKKVARFENYRLFQAKIMIIAAGTVASACQEAVDLLRDDGVKVGLFRPITLRPFPTKPLNNILKKVHKVIFVESSAGQLEKITKAEITEKVEIENLRKPAMAITPEEIYERLKK